MNIENFLVMNIFIFIDILKLLDLFIVDKNDNYFVKDNKLKNKNLLRKIMVKELNL